MTTPTTIAAAVPVITPALQQGEDHTVPTWVELTPTHPHWPARTMRAPHPPFVLWARGNPNLSALLARSVTITGTRACSLYGRDLAMDVGSHAATHGITVVTGGAYGIDAAALRGALAAGGTPVVILPGGVDVTYPLAHHTLLHEVIEAGGAVMAARVPGSAPTRTSMLERLTLMPALTCGMIIVETGLRSGAVHAATVAHAAGVPIHAFPHRAHDLTGSGNNHLIKQGTAALVTTVEEALAFPDLTNDATSKHTTPSLGEADTSDVTATAGVTA